MQTKSTPLIVFYGDDFTGSSENLAQYHRHGLRAALFLDPTRPDEIRYRAHQYDVIGIAGVARSLDPQRMAEEIRPAFRLFHDLSPRFVQYKICSTFDSSPTVGNFGIPISAARETWPDCVVAVQAAMPEQGRFTAFGNHFASFGEHVFRLDRHPSMSRHPSTPMTEADLGKHLAQQSETSIAYIHAPSLDGPLVRLRDELERHAKDGSTVIFDGLNNIHLLRTAELLWDTSTERPVFTLAAQGMAHGLGQHLARDGQAVPDGQRPDLSAVPRMLVVSGSCALQTAQQIERAEAAGWATVRLDVPALLTPDRGNAALQDALTAANRHFREGRDVVIFTARGPDDPTLAEVRDALARWGLSADESARRIGGAFAEIVRHLVPAYGLRRLIFSGGDTSSYALRNINAFALTIDHVDVGFGGHMCRLHAEDPAIHGLQVLLKGGQIGSDDLFEQAKAGR